MKSELWYVTLKAKTMREEGVVPSQCATGIHKQKPCEGRITGLKD